MKDLRLLQIVPSLESGGVEQGTIDVANLIADNGYNSFITSNGGRMLGLLNRKNVKHINLPVHSKNPLIMFKNIKQIENIIKMNHINLVHVRSRAPAWSLFYASKYGCKTVSTFHNVYGHQNVLKRFYNRGLSKVDKIVAISEFVKSSIVDLYGISHKKITVIYRGIDTDFFDSNKVDQNNFMKLFSEYNIPEDKKIILYPGRLTPWKGQIEFLKILQLLDTSKITCYFIGDEKNINYSKKLKNEIIKSNLESVCKVLGHLSKEEMRFMYKISDVVVSAPLVPEGFGRTISEGLAMKKIVLCYNYGGVKDQISGLDKFFSINPHNKLEMVEKIKTSFEVIDDKKSHLGEISRNHIIKKFSKKTMTENYFKLYQEII